MLSRGTLIESCFFQYRMTGKDSARRVHDLQCMFAVITPALITGTHAQRINFPHSSPSRPLGDLRITIRWDLGLRV